MRPSLLRDCLKNLCVKQGTVMRLNTLVRNSIAHRCAVASISSTRGRPRIMSSSGASPRSINTGACSCDLKAKRTRFEPFSPLHAQICWRNTADMDAFRRPSDESRSIETHPSSSYRCVGSLLLVTMVGHGESRGGRFRSRKMCAWPSAPGTGDAGGYLGRCPRYSRSRRPREHRCQ